MADDQGAEGTISADSPQAPDLPDADFRDQVATAMHNLNNVLSVVQLTADLIERDAIDQASAVETIREQVQEAVKLVEGLRLEARGRSQGGA
ncbi:MAG: histidine kinase dimerization/phospho-acceptor domain-containing protein [Dehalococcoidia bacterium]